MFGFNKKTVKRYEGARCSFCGKPQRKATKIIASPDVMPLTVYICDVCVRICYGIIDEEGVGRPSK